MNHIKVSCLIENGNRSRFLIVDAYNEQDVLKYYEKHEFQFLFSTEDQEREYFHFDAGFKMKTRFMYFDLLLLKQVIPELFL